MAKLTKDETNLIVEALAQHQTTCTRRAKTTKNPTIIKCYEDQAVECYNTINKLTNGEITL